MGNRRASGGLIGKSNKTSGGGNAVTRFNASGTFTAQPSTTTVDVLTVAGGGAGGRGNVGGGGGGAGGFRNLTSEIVTPGGSFPITVGAGASGSGSNAVAADGSDSIFSNPISPITSDGGGGGGATTAPAGRAGGSGGGSYDSGSVGAGNTPPVSPVQGYAGGGSSGSAPQYYAGGGGGAGGVGISGATPTNRGSGGPGAPSSVTGTATYYAGGGSGSVNDSSNPQMSVGGGGRGGGGNNDTNGSAGTTNTGGGGGGGGATSGSGGSGVVIVKELDKAQGVFDMKSQYTAHTKGQWPMPHAYEISNSLRFNDDDSPKLQRTPSATGNRSKFTFSSWVKLSKIGSQANLMSWITDSNNAGEIRISSGNVVQAFEFQGGTQNNGFGIYSTRLLRDPSAWYHIVVSVDTTAGVNGLLMYINGEEITYATRALGGGTNLECQFNLAGEPMKIGCDRDDGAEWDGYMAETCWIDGQTLHPSHFGEPDPDCPQIWRPKEYLGTYGLNGFHLEFKQSGVGSGSTSTVGADTSGNSNHLDSTNVAATDQSTDTPTNNFCTLNSLANSSYTTLSEGNLKTTGNSASNNGNTEATMAVANGKWYWEHKMTTSASPYYPTTGALKPETVGRLINGGTNGMVGVVTDSVGYEFDGDRRISNTSTDDHFASLSNGDILGIALDMDNGAVYFSKAGSWQNSSDPTSGGSKTNAAHTWTADGRYMMPATASYNGSVAEINFGSPTFSISSGNADANGYGNFEYSVPSGYYALCSKNLAQYG